MPASDRKAKNQSPRGPSVPIRKDDYRQPEAAAELPAGVPASVQAGLMEREEGAGESTGAPESPRR